MKRIFYDKEHRSRLILFLYSLSIVFAFILIDRFFFVDHIKKTILSKGYEQIQERETFLNEFSLKATTTLLAIHQNDFFQRYLSNPTLADLEHLKKQFMLISQINSNIMQLRFLDKDGNEMIRVDRTQEYENPFFASILQNKKERYYFTNSQVMPLDKVWFSSLDLNIENDVVEIPYKPTIRAILPVSLKNEFTGMLIINYFMKDFLNQLVDIALYKAQLVDAKGNILIHYDENRSWSAYKNRKYTLENEYEEFQEILANETYETNDFISKKLDFPSSNSLYIILEPKEAYLDQEISNHCIKYVYTIAIVVLLTFFASYFVSKMLRSILEDLKTTKKLNERLSDLYERFFAILNTTNDSIIVLNENQQIEFCNKATTELIKYFEEELLNQNISLFIKNQTLFSTHFEYVLKKDKVKTYENICTTKDNHEVVFLTTLIKIKNKNSVLMVSRDITELKHKEIELKEKEEIILQQSKIATMGEMLENIAHQWRQPLSIISTSASGLQLQVQMNNFEEKQVNEGLDNIINTTNYLSQTIEDFRNFFSTSKILELFEISSIIDKTLYLLTSRLTSAKVRVVINKEKTYFVKGVKNEMIQCFMNILTNATDEFERNEKISLRLIMINLFEENNHIIVEVQDNAGGIPDKIINRVFEAHFTTKVESGTGIGLYMTQKIIQKSFHGKIEVFNKEFTFEKELYKGACFKISVPLE